MPRRLGLPLILGVLTAGCAAAATEERGGTAPRGADAELSWEEPATLELRTADSAWTVRGVRMARGRIEEVHDPAVTLRISSLWLTRGEVGFDEPRPLATIPVVEPRLFTKATE